MITTEKLKEIADLAKSVPEVFQLKCFDLLLSHYLSGQVVKHDTVKIPPEMKRESRRQPFVLPIDIKAFLNQYTLDVAVLNKLYYTEGKNIRPVYKLKVHKKATAQIQHALLMALENAFTSGEFKFNIKTLRQRCRDLKCIDSANFTAILRKNAALFKNLSLDDEESVFLSSEGKAKLADIIEGIVNE